MIPIPESESVLETCHSSLELEAELESEWKQEIYPCYEVNETKWPDSNWLLLKLVKDGIILD